MNLKPVTVADHRRLGGLGKEVVLSCDEQNLPEESASQRESGLENHT
jgi:hypothetical protein